MHHTDIEAIKKLREAGVASCTISGDGLITSVAFFAKLEESDGADQDSEEPVTPSVQRAMQYLAKRGREDEG